MTNNIRHARSNERPRLLCRWSCDAEGRLACVWKLEFPPGSAVVRDASFRAANLTPCEAPASIRNGGSRKGSKGNAVRVERRNAVAAPATVSGELATSTPLGMCHPREGGRKPEPASQETCHR
jgi:hypothetical protein